MKTKIGLVLAAIASFSMLSSCNSKEKEASPRERTSLNKEWNFALNADSTRLLHGEVVRKLNLPHDWAIEGTFSEKNPSGCGGGALPGGIGWYSKEFTLEDTDSGKKIFIDFEGVYMNSKVFINDFMVGERPYGYISFRYDLTPYVHPGKNILKVRVDNSEQPNSRWYSGCGIYRNVWLVKTNPIYVDLWGTYVTTPVVNEKQAIVKVVTTLKNETSEEVNAELTSLVLDAKKKEIAKSVSTVKIGKRDPQEVTQEIQVEAPVLWTLENPAMYTLRTQIRKEGILVDQYDTPMGIRTFQFDAQKGFFLNGKQVKIKGVCMHHDLGCLGSAFNVRAAERQLQILKEMGVNGFRCSHNPPAPEMLDLLDRMGFIVMDEAFDMWRKRKTTYDYSRYFNQWHERDLTDLVLRDRNHPSIFMWSIGNEVLEQWTDAKADTLDIQSANLLLNLKRDPNALAQEDSGMSVNSLLTKKLAGVVRGLDPTRPVTAGNNESSKNNHLFRAKALDIIGFNYHEYAFKDVPSDFPGMPFIETESTSALMTRGYYRMPSDSLFAWPVAWDKPFYDSTFSCSSYDNCRAQWGSTHEQAWRVVKNLDFVSGMYIWTGFDYIGEPTPFWWPARSSYFGIIDLAGFPKDVYYMYQSEWTDKDVLHLFPHWNWKPGEVVDLWAYYNNADEVELFVNGKSQGVKTKGKDEFHVMWRVPFEAGSIKVISRKDGKEVLTREIKTAGEPAQIRLTPDRSEIAADGTDLSFVTVEILDKDGNLCPWAENLVNFEVEGSAFVAGVDNGSPISLESFKASNRKAFYGKCLVVLQNNGTEGKIQLKATSEGLQDQTIKLKAEE